MKKRLRLLILFTLPALASCGGFSLNYIVEGNKYNSPVFTENYYEHWDSEFKNVSSQEIDVTSKKIMSFNDIGVIDKNLLVDNPYASLSFMTDQIRAYSNDYNLMRADESFYYGVQSKLFDGQAYCDGYFQKHRVQSNEKGFSVRFQKESDELTYFAMQFKATTNNQIECYKVGSDDLASSDGQLFHESVINLYVTLYVKNDSGAIVGHKFKSLVDITKHINENTGETIYHTNNGEYYMFYGFDLTEYNLSRLVGFSVTFDIVSDSLIEWNETKGITNIDYALFIYEVFLPYTYWH